MDSESFRATRTIPVLPTHLDSPLRGNLLEKIVRLCREDYVFPQRLKRSERELKRLADSMKELMAIANVSFKELQLGIQPLLIEIPKIHAEELADSRRLLLNIGVLAQQLQLVTQILPASATYNPETLGLIENALSSSPEVRHAYALRQWATDAVIITSGPKERVKSSIDHSKWHPRSREGYAWGNRADTLNVFVNKDFSIVHINGQPPWIGTRDHFLMIADVLNQRYQTLVAAVVAEASQDMNYLTPKHLLGTFVWGDRIIARLGNEGYNLIAKWESLILGLILKSFPDPLVNNSQFFDHMCQDFTSSQGASDDDFKEILSIYDEVKNERPLAIFQLFGLFRIWGHPTIDSAQGILKLKQVACKPRFMNIKKIHLIRSKFMEYFFVGYYHKHSKYPAYSLSHSRPGSYLYACLRRNLRLNPDHKAYRLTDWHWIKGEKTFDIPKCHDLAELISDKAMSFTLDELVSNIRKHGDIGQAHDRSVLIKWMQSELGDPEEFLKDIDKNGFGVIDNVTGVCPKEREMKIFARMFGLLTFKKRMYVVLTEALIAEFFVPYFPEITMMDSQSKLLNKHYTATKGMGSAGMSKTIVINTDFAKWNSNMREEETKKIFQDMDNFLGFDNCIARTHEMFAGALYLADKTITPKIKKVGNLSGLQADEYTWFNHLGGIEGLRQKGWTIWTVVVLRYLSEKHPFKCIIMGQGDNQVLLCTYAPHKSITSIKESHDNFLRDLDDFISDFGPPLKLEETWASSTVFIYGKFPIVQGTPYQMDMKKISRMSYLSNDGLPTLDSALSSLSANLFDSCSLSHTILTPYCTYILEVLEGLHFHLRHSLLSSDSYFKRVCSKPVVVIPDGSGGQIKDSITDSFILKRLGQWTSQLQLAFLNFPKCLGGYAIANCFDVMQRGFPDPLTHSLAYLKKFRTAAQVLGLNELTKWVSAMLTPVISPVVQYSMLIEDPVSVNLFHPSSPGDQVKRDVFKFLQSDSLKKSKRFKEFLLLMDPLQTELIDTLMKMTPVINPRVLHEVLHATVSSNANHVIQRINKTGTLINLMIKSHEGDLFRKLSTSEVNYLGSVLYQLSTHGRLPFSLITTCASVGACTLRNWSWKCTISGVTVASPLEALKPIVCVDTLCSNKCLNQEKGYIFSKDLCQEDKDIRPLKLGPSKPFLGSVTRAKFKSYGVEVSRNTVPILRRICNLLSLIGWATDPDSNLSSLLDLLLKSVTDLPLQLFMLKSGSVSGTVEHRFQDSATSHGCYLPVLYTKSSWCTMSTSYFTAYAKGSKNVNINFQSFLIWIEVLTSQTVSLMGKGVHWHQDCPDCIMPVNESRLDLSITPTASIFKTAPHNPYFWISLESTPLLHKVNRKLHTVLTADQLTDHVSNSECFHSLAAQHVFSILRKSDVFFSHMKFSNYDSSIVPVGWTFVMDPIKFLTRLGQLLWAAVLFHLGDIPSDEKPMVLRISTIISNIPPVWCQSFSELIQNKILIDSLTSSGVLMPPAGCPPSLTAWGRAFCDALRRIIERPNFFFLEPLIFCPNSYVELSPFWIQASALWGRGELSSSSLQSVRSLLSPAVYSDTMGLVQISDQIEVALADTNNPLSRELSQEVLDLVNRDVTFYYSWSTADYWAHLLSPYSPEYTARQFVPPSQLLITSSYLDTPTSCSDLHHTTQLTIKGHTLPTIPGPGYANYCKPFGRSTTCIYKAFSIFSLIRPKTRRALLVGDGAGAMTTAFLSLNPENRAWFNTLLEAQSLGPQEFACFFPSDLYGLPEEFRDRVKGLGKCLLGISDITNPGWASQYYDLPSNLLIISDAELPYGEYSLWLQAINNLLDLAFHLNQSSIIFKCYLTNLHNFMLIYLHMNMVFQTIKIIRSQYSNENQTEVYVYATQQRKKRLTFVYNFINNELLLKGNFSVLKVQSLVDQLSNLRVPYSSPIQDPGYDLLCLQLFPCDHTELVTLYHLPVAGVYPDFFLTSTHTLLSRDYTLSLFRSNILNVNRFTVQGLSRLAECHLIFLSAKIHDQHSFDQWLKIHKLASLVVWQSLTNQWCSGIHESHTRISGEFVKALPLVQLIPTRALKVLIKHSSILKYYGCLKNLLISSVIWRRAGGYRADRHPRSKMLEKSYTMKDPIYAASLQALADGHKHRASRTRHSPPSQASSSASSSSLR